MQVVPGSCQRWDMSRGNGRRKRQPGGRFGEEPPETSNVPELCPILRGCLPMGLGFDACHSLAHVCTPLDCHAWRLRHYDDLSFVWFVSYSLIRLLFCWVSASRFSSWRGLLLTSHHLGARDPNGEKGKENNTNCYPCEKKADPITDYGSPPQRVNHSECFRCPVSFKAGERHFCVVFLRGSFWSNQELTGHPVSFDAPVVGIEGVGVRQAVRYW
ncbi:hypothetical protein B0T26DRAFT_97979 [Lasiosphaeria miniovina]|uniref:Uncharacterized protein n=1 Tax=Lasiosphaeria miniovina TaxID=1954250 RepID=A0AA40EE90_9PEZI|nr:uncharacterized protein B0T26DRAFT_97979 [Lasiosphaeria miniovina]KAK0735187.1 hypothetical protein B0T26DRAFT_97979 [Lasiosphaeria miniovina]